MFDKRLAEIAEEERERPRWKPLVISLVAAAIIALLASTAWFAFGSPAHAFQAGEGGGGADTADGRPSGETRGSDNGGGCGCIRDDGSHSSWSIGKGTPFYTSPTPRKISPSDKQSGAHGGGMHGPGGKQNDPFGGSSKDW